MKNRPGINIVHGSIPATEEVMTFYHSQDAFQIYEAFVQLYLAHIFLTPLEHVGE